MPRNNLERIQDENRRLKAENEKLREELELKNKIISSLEAKLCSSSNGGIIPSSSSGMGAGGDSPEKSLRRNSSDGVTQTSNPKLKNSFPIGTSPLGLPPRGPESEVDELKIPPDVRPSSSRGSFEGAASSSLRPPSRNTVEMQSPMAPVNAIKKFDVEFLPILDNDILETGKGGQSDAVIIEEDDGEGGEDHRNTGKAKPLIKSSKGAIKALPREMSIYNSQDDDITKYSIDDGLPTYELGKTEMRDAYNARGIYTGAVSRKEQMPHFRGRMEYHHQGRVYDGDWHMGHWHGYGMIQNALGDVYEGKVVNDLKEGEGKMVYSDGRVFKGRFKEDEAVKGTLTFPDGAKYIGEVHNVARHGYGVYMFADGSQYEGQSVMDMFEGEGKMTWTDGGWYEGEWTQGEIHGYGMEIRPDGSLRHKGHWSKGVPIRL